ncbi:hypothetical protein BCR36DRAFT_101952 [Piromyces finnis]|uniref:polynucleotide adenylyltransferase n=1 Tax=Piromyces finnis TaxID=1754191 RepID=A0A1Y1V548_9FUNG|nr:hypothetical protein BCR36DRAFT_101952 [Piromyces finnis]|eukprot:ORX46700.1 hypothetical protein BCR36DRAFT_101952 [Piromyces finnis]
MLNKNNKKKENKNDNIKEINNKMNKKNNRKDNNSIKQNNYNNSDNININLSNKSINLSDINEKEYQSLNNLEDNKKNKHSSSFQQATELIHSIQSFFHSLKKSNNNNSNSDNLDTLNCTPSSNKEKKQSLSDTDLNIQNDNQTVEEETYIPMEKIKIQRSKSIPFNNTNSTQRNSCHYHKHSSLSSMTSSVTTISINNDIGHQYDSGSETNESRVEYSTPKEDEFSFSFSSCQSSFSFASAFTNKMGTGMNSHAVENKDSISLSPTSISSGKSDNLSLTPHIKGPLENIIGEHDVSSVTETITSSYPVNNKTSKDDLGKMSMKEEISIKESVRINNKKDSFENKSKEEETVESDKHLKITSSSMSLDQSLPSTSLESPSLDIPTSQDAYSSSPLSTKSSSHNDDENKKFIKNEQNPLSPISPSQPIPPTKIKTKSSESFKIEKQDSQLIFEKSSPKVSKGKSMLLFSSSNNIINNNISEQKNNNNELKKEPSSNSLNNGLNIENVTDSEKTSLTYKDVVVHNLVNKEISLVISKGATSLNVNNSEKENKNKTHKIEVQDPKDKINRKVSRNGSKDNYLNPLYNNVLNEDTLVESENSSFMSNIVCVSESESTSIPTTNAFPGDITNNLENKSSNLIIEDLDNAEEEFIQISSNDLDNNGKLYTINENEKIEPIITIEDTDELENLTKNTESKINSDHILKKPSKEILTVNESLLKERNPNGNQNNIDNEMQFSKETTSSIAIKNSQKRDEDNYSYYSNAFSPEISISSVHSEEKYSKNYYEKSQYYKKNGKKSADFEKSIKEYAASLEKEMLDFYTKNLPNEESKTKKLSLLKRIQKIFSDRYPNLGVKAHLFGSSANELGTYNSDVDICLTTNDRVDCELSDMEVIKKILEENNITKIRTTPNAKVPICNFVDPETNLSCDINVNNTIALYNTKMIQTYALIDERVKPLIMTIKYFARQRMLNDAKTGTLSSYCWVNMVINFLQMRKPPILPCLHAMTKDIPQEERIIVDGIDCTIYTDLDKLKGFGKDNKETLYELIFGFFKTFACDFDYITDVVSVRSGCYKKKSDNGWNVSSNNTRIRNNYFCVEEPFNTTRNLANCANRYSVKGLRWEFKRAFKILKSRGPLEELCEPYKPNPSNYAYTSNYYYQNQSRSPENNSYTSNGTIHNDHLFISNPANPFSNLKNGKGTTSFPGSMNVADKNGNWRIRNNNNNSSSPSNNNSLENSPFQNKKLAWNTKKKPTDPNDTTSSSTSPPSESYYYARRFPNDNSFLNNHYSNSNSSYINNKRNNNFNRNNYIDKDIHNNRKHDKSNYVSNKETDEMDNEKIVIKNRFIEHHRNIDNSTSLSSSPQYYYNNSSNLSINRNKNAVSDGRNDTKAYNENKLNNNYNRSNNMTTNSITSTYASKTSATDINNISSSNENIVGDNSQSNIDQVERKKNKGKNEIKDDTQIEELENDKNETESNEIKDMDDDTNNEATTSSKGTEDQTNSSKPVIINNFNNYYSYVNQECAQFYKQFVYVQAQDQKMTLTEEGISKQQQQQQQQQQQNIINSARYPPYPIFINLNNSNVNSVTTQGNSSSSSSSSSSNKIKPNGENSQSVMTGYTTSFPVLSGNAYGHYYTKLNNVNLINYFIPAQTAAHPPGSPYQSRAQPLGYAVETIPIIPATNQAIYASNNNITIPEGSLYHTYQPLVPVVVDNSLNPILASRENIPKEISHDGVLEDKKDLTKESKSDRSSKTTFSGNKKYYGKLENKKSQWPNSQFLVNKANKKSSGENGHTIGKQKSKENEEGSNTAKDNYKPQKKKPNYLHGDNSEENGNKMENFAIKNTGKNDGPTEFSLASHHTDEEQAIIYLDGNKSEEERTLYNEEISCEPGEIYSKGEEPGSEEDCKGQNSNINIRNNLSGSKGSEFLLNIKNKNSSIEINLENNIIVNDVLIDYKNNKENKINTGKGKKSFDSSIHDNKKNEKGKLAIKGVGSISSNTNLVSPPKEKKNKKNNANNKSKDNKMNNQNKSEVKEKSKHGCNIGNQKNKNNYNKNNKASGSTPQMSVPVDFPTGFAMGWVMIFR